MTSTRKSINKSIIKQLLYKQKYLCYICNTLLPSSYQVDHIIPHCINKDNSEENLQALCPNCHSIKTQRENERIIKFKKYKAKHNLDNICWFCLESLDFSSFQEHLQFCCNHILKPISLKNIYNTENTINIDNEEESKLTKKFVSFCDNLLYVKDEKNNSSKSSKLTSQLSPILKIDILLNSNCIFINNIIYKINTGNINVDDITNAINFATKTKINNNRYDTLEITLMFESSIPKEDIHEEDLDECYKHIENLLIDKLPERILKSNDVINIIFADDT